MTKAEYEELQKYLKELIDKEKRRYDRNGSFGYARAVEEVLLKVRCKISEIGVRRKMEIIGSSQFVINILEEDYETLMNINDDRLPSIIARKHLYNALASGTPIPKGHGRLIDVDALFDYFGNDAIDEVTRSNIIEYFIRESKATIIEADKSESEVDG